MPMISSEGLRVRNSKKVLIYRHFKAHILIYEVKYRTVEVDTNDKSDNFG